MFTEKVAGSIPALIIFLFFFCCGGVNLVLCSALSSYVFSCSMDEPHGISIAKAVSDGSIGDP